MEIDPDTLPETTEEAEIFLDPNIKTNAEIAAQLATALTLDWNNFDDDIYRRNVTDLVEIGIAVCKRNYLFLINITNYNYFAFLIICYIGLKILGYKPTFRSYGGKQSVSTSEWDSTTQS